MVAEAVMGPIIAEVAAFGTSFTVLPSYPSTNPECRSPTKRPE